MQANGIHFIDAHNHLHDRRFGTMREELLEECFSRGVSFSVVNGTSPDDWPSVLELAKRSHRIIPSFGVHPWYINDIPSDWTESLLACLDSTPSAVGEIGIDGWRTEFDSKRQEEIFLTQLQIAAERNLPVSIHGLRKWGRLLELLTKYPRPRCGFLLHSYGGPVEMIQPFAKLGGYFSCPGFFLNRGREMKHRVFAEVPEDRLLIETDAPDQNLPPELDRYHLVASEGGARINHPATIVEVYEHVAALRNVPLTEFATQIERNFRALFGPQLQQKLPNT
jgi:TatD DNase family protein